MKKHFVLSGIPLPYFTCNFENIVLPPDILLDFPVQKHPDMILTVFRNVLYCHESYYINNKELIDYIVKAKTLSLVLGKEERTKKYPHDCGYNTLICNDIIIGRKASLSPMLSDICTFNTNQGYAGCTALFAKGTVITADKSTIKTCKKAGIPFFEISGEDISLPGYNTGFIGGACGVLDDKIYIYGDYNKSKSGALLKQFCIDKGLDLISLYDGPVTDIGGIKFI